MIELSSGIKKASILISNPVVGDIEFHLRHCSTNEEYILSYSEYEQNERYLTVDFGDFNGVNLPYGEYEYKLYDEKGYIICGLMKYYDDYVIEYCQDRIYYEYGG